MACWKWPRSTAMQTTRPIFAREMQKEFGLQKRSILRTGPVRPGIFSGVENEKYQDIVGSTSASLLGQTATVDVKDFGYMSLQIGANENQIMDVRIPDISLENMGIENLNYLTYESASRTITQVDNALSFVSSVRAKLGAYQNRLDHTISSLDVADESLTSSYSRIMDTDMAEEMTTYTQYNVLQQAGVSVLAQANDLPQTVLQLLQ